MALLGLDIGGANLKAATPQGRILCRPFEVWKYPDQLAGQVRTLLSEFVDPRPIAVTLTAELCDCYATKRDGVQAVLDAVTRAAGTAPVFVWQTDGRLVTTQVARRNPLLAAAANWRALAELAGRLAPAGAALLIDVGSTTTDLIPLRDGQPVPEGRTDPQRLASSELVYSGIRRTPICALMRSVPWRGRCCPVAAEWFATTLDVYLTLGDLAEEPDNTRTADGRPATRKDAHDRLARVICADREMFDAQDARTLAQTVRDAQQQQIAAALARVVNRLGQPPRTVVLSGEGEFLARRVLQSLERRLAMVSLAEKFSPEVGRAACAYALAVVAGDRLAFKEYAK